jgi:lipoprotein-anchoring transpeptidase ErfK/SrfK
MKFAVPLSVVLAMSAAACSDRESPAAPPGPAQPPAAESGRPPATGTVTPEQVNAATWQTLPETEAEQTVVAVVARVQVLLDRAGFSPGVTDGRFGENVGQAIEEYQRQNDLPGDGQLTQALFDRLAAESSADVVSRYVLTEEDVAGPFTPSIPRGLAEQAELDALGYRSASESIAERFHMDEQFLLALNPGADFSRAGEEIHITNPRRPPIQGEVARIEVDAEQKSVRAYAEDGTLLAFYPATIGSSESPSPSGAMTVNGVARNPTYTYDPSRVSYANDTISRRLVIAAGPNNPVGSIWIDLSRDTYGIHGTPNPDIVGKNASNGCVRLTNWDVAHLAAAVRPGVEVEFI